MMGRVVDGQRDGRSRRRRCGRVRAVCVYARVNAMLESISRGFSLSRANIFASVPLSIQTAEAGDAKRKQF